jgi:hypothetical protein
VDGQAGVGLPVDLVQEVAEVDGPVLGRQLADDLAGGGVQGGEQVDGAVPDVVMAAPLGDTGDHRQHRRGPLQRLDLRLLVDREDRRVRRGRQVQADHIADLVDQQRVGGDLEVFGAPRLQAEGPPDAVHAGRRDPHPPGQLPLGPVRGTLRDLFQGAHHYLLHLGIGDGARYSRARLIAQSVQPPGQEPGPPYGDRAAVDAQPGGDSRVAAAVRAGQHDPRPHRQALRGAAAHGPVL